MKGHSRLGRHEYSSLDVGMKRVTDQGLVLDDMFIRGNIGSHVLGPKYA